MKNIVDELFACSLPFQSPRENNCCCISDAELEEKFKA